MNSKKLIKKLESLSKNQLIAIADNYHIYGSKNMDKKELIDLIIMNETGHAPKKVDKSQKAIRTKITNSALLWNIMFISAIIAFLFISIQSFVNQLYFFPKFRGNMSKNDLYGIFLTLAGFIWSIYIYSRWIKIGFLSPFIVISFALSLGWFIYSSINNYALIEKYNQLVNAFEHVQVKMPSNLNIYKQFKIFYWIIVGSVSFCVTLSFSIYLYKTIIK